MARKGTKGALRRDGLILGIAMSMLFVGGDSVAAQAAPSCTIVTPEAITGWKAVRLGQAWSGVRVPYPALEHRGSYYFGYYNALRQMTVAKYDPSANKLCVNVMESVFGGWDSHNAIVLAFDSDDYLHVAGNMHVSPLIYARASEPNSVAGLSIRPMVGRDEGRTTYPRFDRDYRGRLLFMYRSGGSGNGKWIVNILNNGAWQRAGRGVSLADHDRDGALSAYPTEFLRDSTGTFHVAVVWRRTSDPGTNFLVSYASTKDFRRWYTASGRPIDSALDPDNADVVDAVGQGKGLVTQVRMDLDENGVPVIAYSKYGPDGRNALYLARPSGGQWSKILLASGGRHAQVSGRANTMRNDVTRTANLDAKQGAILVTFPGDAPQRLGFDPKRLTPHAVVSAKANAARQKKTPSLPDIPAGLLEPSLRKVTVPRSDGSGSGAFVQYFAQSALRDRPIPCSAGYQSACKPPSSPILLFLPE